jgi:HAD superfamily hydrolase (TIGR01459 family)
MIGQFAQNYDGLIVDIWGVLHDGVKPYPGVLDCLARLRAAGKRVVFLTNAPRRPAGVAAALSAMGITPDLYDGIMSSGEAVHEGLRDRTGEFSALGRRFYHLGPARDSNVFAGLDLEQVPMPDAADFLLNTGPDDLLGAQTAELYEPVLRAALAAGLPMICANPDMEVVRDGVRIICAGALAADYTAAGGRVIMRGKPDAAIYEPTLALLGTARARTLAVGDSLKTDLAGAAAAGLDALWVLSGIHDETPAEAMALAAASGITPIGIVPGFTW